MCGIAGFSSAQMMGKAETTLRAMTHAIAHRGPDGEGHWFDEGGLVALGQRRLAIQDLSSAGAQPMHSANSRYSLTYNGEIYNHFALRKMLSQAGHQVAWKGQSDTETLLECISFYGLESTLELLNGMFAIALFDREEQVVTLVRDRIGEKPLYYYHDHEHLVFASELKSLIKHSSVSTDIDAEALNLFFRHSSIPAPHTIYSKVKKLLPAQMLQWSVTEKKIINDTSYWNLNQVANDGVENPLVGSDDEILQSLESSLLESISMRTISDVPLGAFLSGGIDSSLIVALMSKVSAAPVKTFTVGFSEAEYDESVHAAAVAKHLGTDHTEMRVTEQDALNIVPQLAHIWDEPFADASQIPTHLISVLTREHVTVSMSGDGGDELFCGYTRYADAVRLWEVIQSMPGLVRKMAAVVSNSLSLPLMNVLQALTNKKPESLYKMLIRSNSVSGSFQNTSFESFYRWMLCTVREQIVITGNKLEPDHNDQFGLWNKSHEHGMMLEDMGCYLPDTILTKVDRASMAASLESRAPFLDHKFVELAWQVPLELKYKDSQAKWPLKQMLKQYVPENLYDRPKQGFGVPIDSWLTGSLLDWAESLLDEKNLKEQGFVDHKAVGRIWSEHKRGLCNWQYQLWTVLMFQAWLKEQGDWHG